MAERAGADGAEGGSHGESPSAVPLHDILVAVPFLHRLSTKLLGMSAVVALAALAALWFAERRMQGDLVDQLARSTALLGDVIQTSAQQAMLDARPAHAYANLERVGELEGIERVRILDTQGRVVFSTAAADVGQLIGQEGRACTACHGVSLAALDANVLAFRRGFVAVLSAAVLVLAALLFLFGRAEVVEPVAALLEGTRRVARDDLDVEIRVHSSGELGLLARSFNEMTRSLRRLEDELSGVLAGLEGEVESRTCDLREAQEQLVRTEKLSSLGKLSASIAHEINNPLAGILTFAKLVSRTLAEGPPDDAQRAALQRNLALIERETQRCSAIVRNLLDFARERPMQPRPLDPRAPLDEALSLVQNQFQTLGIAIERDLSPVPEVVGDFGQLRQAFVNIVMNACEAMGTSGRLRVTTRALGEEVAIAFEDSGPGIAPERLSKIFDPFFTTKEKGTGLGLSVVYGIVERHGGAVAVASELGRGTTFTIRLPFSATRAEPARAARAASV